MRHALVAIAGLAALAAVGSTRPASAQFFDEQVGADPMNQGQMQYLDEDSRIQQSPIPRQRVEFDAKYAPGTIVISTEERRLYFVTAPGEAIEYGVGVGRPGFGW